MTEVNILPEVSYNYPIIEITGNSVPEDANIFWLPFVDELERLLNNWERIRMVFKFDYFNTGTKRYLTVIFGLLQEYKYRVDVEVFWYYLSDDTDTKELGQDYKDSCTIKIHILERH